MLSAVAGIMIIMSIGILMAHALRLSLGQLKNKRPPEGGLVCSM